MRSRSLPDSKGGASRDGGFKNRDKRRTIDNVSPDAGPSGMNDKTRKADKRPFNSSEGLGDQSSKQKRMSRKRRHASSPIPSVRKGKVRRKISTASASKNLAENEFDHMSQLSLELICRILQNLPLCDVMKLEHLSKQLQVCYRNLVCYLNRNVCMI